MHKYALLYAARGLSIPCSQHHEYCHVLHCMSTNRVASYQLLETMICTVDAVLSFGIRVAVHSDTCELSEHIPVCGCGCLHHKETLSVASRDTFHWVYHRVTCVSPHCLNSARLLQQLQEVLYVASVYETRAPTSASIINTVNRRSRTCS